MATAEQNNNLMEKSELETSKLNTNSNQDSATAKPSQELLNNPYVQELLLKIDVLKRGIFKERKTNQELSAKLKKFEAELTSKIVALEEEVISKTSRVKMLIQEKINLEKKLKTQQAEKKKIPGFLEIINKGFNDKIINGLTNTNNKKLKKEKDEIEVNMDSNSVEAVSAMANAEIRKLYEKISELKFENETYFKKMNNALEEVENNRLIHKDEIKNYTDKINSLEEDIKKLKNEKQDLNNKINLHSSISTENIKEIEHFKGLLSEYKTEKDQANIKLKTYKEKYDKLMEENIKYKEELLRYEENSGKMAKKLSELKNLIIKLNLRNQMFHVKKIGVFSSYEIDIIFGNYENGNFIMRIDDKNQKEIINILDVESVEKVEGSNNKINIAYMKNGKKYNLVVMVDELIIDQMIKAYKMFFAESMKKSNQINY